MATTVAKYKDVLPALHQELNYAVSSFDCCSHFLLLQQYKEVTDNKKIKPAMAA